MKKLVLAALCIALAGCAVGNSLARLNGPRQDWSCSSGSAFSIRINEGSGKAEVFAGGRLYDLDRDATGYSNSEVRFFEQGGMASLTGAHGGPYNSCRRT